MALATALSIEDLLAEARARGASDLHLVPGAPPTLRISGGLQPIGEAPLSGDEIHQLLSDFMLARGLAKCWRAFPERIRELDAGIVAEFLGRVRCNCFLDRGAPAAALRLIPPEIPTLEELRLPPVARRLIERRKGLLLVTGSSGAGKTTTQVALIDVIAARFQRRIITIEAPIEYLLQHRQSLVSQREVGRDTGSFAEALRAALREDADVILVGEMRDLETMQAALTAAETGHLVLATLHTNDAAQAIDRIIDLFPPRQQAQVRSQLADVLLAVIAQQLLPARCPQSGRPELRGRVVGCEVLLGPMADIHAARAPIREGQTPRLYSIMETHQDQGMQTMEMALAKLVRDEVIEQDVARAAAVRRETLETFLAGHATGT